MLIKLILYIVKDIVITFLQNHFGTSFFWHHKKSLIYHSEFQNGWFKIFITLLKKFIWLVLIFKKQILLQTKSAVLQLTVLMPCLSAIIFNTKKMPKVSGALSRCQLCK